MTVWGAVRAIPIGGLVAVGFLDDHRIVVGSHSGLGVYEATTGTLLDRVNDRNGAYGWLRASPPAALYIDACGRHAVPTAGLWGGQLPSRTADGWTCRLADAGADLSGSDGSQITIEDDEEPRALGFSPQGQVLVFATSSTLHIVARSRIRPWPTTPHPPTTSSAATAP